MKIDLDRFTDKLNAVSEKIKQASDVANKDPEKAARFIPSVMEHFRDLQSMDNFNELSEVKEDSTKTKLAISAIHHFLKQSKDAQERVGVLGASLFGSSQFQTLKDHLEMVKKSLEKGKKVDQVEEGHGL